MRSGSRNTLIALALLAVLGLLAFWLLSMPRPLTAADIPRHTADAANGERMYQAAGCISCHQPSPDLAGVDASVPAGGAPLETPVGTLYPMNLTPDPETGIGNWTDLQFVNAVQRGLSPEGEHLIPALPYTSYVHMKPEDVLDIRAYLASLPPVKSPEHEADITALPLIRRGVGLWKWVGLDTTPWQPDPSQSETWNRGSYLVNGPGHCQECHTPRNVFMALDASKAFQGGPHPEGKGRVPSLRGLIERGRYTDAADLASALQYGEVMGYDKLSSGGMGQVQRNISQLPESDIQAIADYIASLE
ncbi:cytochrome c [Aestuariivirga sp.]|uniref:c-type cytochrome n=1 Tax=Aestuariivirga sp. TaxID=2650926 RepID=UPI0035B3B1E3